MPKRGWNIAASGHEWLPLLGLALAWTMVMGGSLLWNQHLVQHKVLENARLEAETVINKDLAYRRWATMHGGVYVHPTAETPPNPWLNHPKRDVTTTDGGQLTLMNPAYMTRQLMTLFSEQYGVKGHITSLMLKNPINAPDEWEREALHQLQQGATHSVSQVSIIDSQRYLRLILPMFMEKGCLKCHADTGIPVGGIRGGISTAVPLLKHELVAEEALKGLRVAHGGIWLLGLALLIGGNNLYRRQKTVLMSTEGTLANSQVRFAALTQSSPTGVFQTEPDGSCIFVNDQWCLLAGITPQQAHDDGWLQVIHPDDRANVFDAWQRTISEQRPFRQEYRFMRPDGKTTWVYGQSSVMQDANGKVIGHVGTVTDISEHKELEQTLRTAKELSDDANRAKSEFLATISHELRTPLNAVMGGAQLLDMTTLSHEQRDYLAMVNIGAKQELALVNDLLDLTAIEAGGVQLSKAPFLLRDSLTAYIKKRHKDCQTKGLQLSLNIDDQAPETILGDEQRFIQAIDILMDNAIKFTDQGTISLSIKPLHLSGAQATLSICVADSGIRIAPEQHEQIFMPFMQADMSHTRKHGGTGLGLSICRRLALAMGGTVRVESTVGKGSSFYLELPFDLCVARPPSTLTVSQEAAEQDRPSASQATGGASPRCRPGSK